MSTAFILAIFSALFNTAPACEYEDGSEMLYDAPYTACSWDAGDSGNGRGDSFVVVKVHDELLYFYEDGHMER